MLKYSQMIYCLYSICITTLFLISAQVSDWLHSHHMNETWRSNSYGLSYTRVYPKVSGLSQ